MAIDKANEKELKFNDPSKLLLVVFGFIFWGIGFIDLIGHTSAYPDVFGLYSLPFFILIILYGSTITIWIVLFFNAKVLDWAVNGVRYIQNHIWFASIFLLGIGISLWVIFEWDRWSRLPGLQLGFFGLIVLAILIFLFSNWNETEVHQRWRRVLGYFLVALVSVEIIIQIIAYLGILPSVHTIGGAYAPYERVYNNKDGFRNDFANRYGWSYPDFKLNDDKQRILIVGGSYVQALQVPPEEQFGALLSELINQDQNQSDSETEIISIGLPGFGPSPYLYEEFLYELLLNPGIISVDEIIVLFHLGDDFQSPVPSINPIVYTVDEIGTVKIHPDTAKLRHDLTHFFMRSYLSIQPVETIRGNYLTPKVISGFIRNWGRSSELTFETDKPADEINFPRLKGSVTDNFAITEPGHAGITSTGLESIPYGNNFIFEIGGNNRSDESFVITRNLLETAQEFLTTNDIVFRVVTIPEFPEAFYDKFNADNWDPEIGKYDLFLPERNLIDIAQSENIPMLPMGNYMYENKLDIDEIKGFYYLNDQGSFTPLGHGYFAKAIFECFYADVSSENCTQ